MTAQVTRTDILDVAREQVLERGVPLTHPQIVEVLRTGDDRLQDLLALAHEVRMKYQGPSVEVEGIVSLKTGGCPEDCHFCSQSGQFTSPVRSVWLNMPELVRAAKQTAATGASEFCIVAAVRGPDDKLMEQMREGVAAIRAAVDINVAASLGMLSREQVDDLVDMGVHRYNHNLEAGRSYFPNVVTTHSFDERWDTCLMVKESGMELCCGGLVGMGETIEQRAELAAQLGELEPHEVPLNFLNPRPARPSATSSRWSRRRAAHDRGLPARPAAHHPAVRRRPRAHPRRPRHPRGPARRHQRRHRRQLPHDARARPARGPRAARRARDADQGPQRDVLTRWCSCSVRMPWGRSRAPARPGVVRAVRRRGRRGRPRPVPRRAELEPPRWCVRCRRRMKVQVTPGAWTATCVQHGTVEQATWG